MNNEVLKNLDKLHTTELGAVRIKQNLALEADMDIGQVADWCKERIQSREAVITRKGKNWYVREGGCVITINAYSYTIITAHKVKESGHK